MKDFVITTYLQWSYLTIKILSLSCQLTLIIGLLVLLTPPAAGLSSWSRRKQVDYYNHEKGKWKYSPMFCWSQFLGQLFDWKNGNKWDWVGNFILTYCSLWSSFLRLYEQVHVHRDIDHQYFYHSELHRMIEWIIESNDSTIHPLNNLIL